MFGNARKWTALVFPLLSLGVAFALAAPGPETALTLFA